MGAAAKILLVILLLSAHSTQAAEYWLWPGAQLPAGADVRRLYLLQGFFAGRAKRPHFIDQGADPRPLRGVRELVLVYRLDALQPPASLVARMARDCEDWQSRGNRVLGVQLDFDSATGRLAAYGKFLQQVRALLPAKWMLGVTGLMDWVNHKDVAMASGVVDELVLQTYQGRQPVPDLQRYLKQLARSGPPLAVPFKLGWVEGEPGEIPESIREHSLFRGEVVFLLGDLPSDRKRAESPKVTTH